MLPMLVENYWIHPVMHISCHRAGSELTMGITIHDPNRTTKDSHTYGGWWRNPAPDNRWFIPLFIGFQTSQVVQDFFHPQYGRLWKRYKMLQDAKLGTDALSLSLSNLITVTKSRGTKPACWTMPESMRTFETWILRLVFTGGPAFIFLQVISSFQKFFCAKQSPGQSIDFSKSNSPER